MAKEKENKTNVMRILDKNKINYEVNTYECDEFIDGVHIADMLGQPYESTFKTLVTEGKSKNYYVFAIPIALELDMKKAVENADLVIESMAENAEEKISFYKRLAPLLPEKTVIVTNSSTLLPSKFAKYTGRPEKFLSLHFANSIWKNNTAEIMSQSKTDKLYFDQIMDFAKDIRMIALPVLKEKSGYLLNSMLVPLLFSGMDLYVNGISDPESIDKAWTLGTGAPKGPFQILDTVGLTTAYNIVSMYVKIPSFLAPYNFKGMEKMLKKYIDEGKLGMSSGEGFYKYKKDKD